jgi:predicted Zn-dependent protease
MKRAERFFAAAAAALAAASLLALPACTSVNPATGEQSFTAFMSPAEELKVGREEHPKVLDQFGGGYDHDGLAAYVDGIGRRLKATSEMPELDFTFTVLDSEVVNAFALPGGYVYVSRGLLALANNEAELAGVMAHEIGHVTGRHSAQRYSTAVATNLGTTGLAILGSIFLGGNAGQAIAQVGQSVSAVYLQSYSREHEFEADTLGVRYLARSGYETAAMAGFLSSLEAYSALEAKVSGTPDPAERYNIMSTHPRTADRVAAATRAANGGAAPGARVGRDEYLRAIDGILFGDSPEQGFVRGQVFAHKVLGFRFEVPDGFILTNSPGAVVARGPDGALIAFAGGKTDWRGPLVELVRRQGLTNAEALTINGYEAATGAARLSRNGTPVDGRLVVIRYTADTLYRFIFLTPPAQTARLNEPLRRTTFSFRALTRGERDALQPWRIRIHQVRPGDTVGRLAARLPMAGPKEEWLRVLNGMGPGDGLRAGQLVKLVSE